MEISELIRTKRIERGLTLKEVAEYVGVSDVAVSKWEKGKIDNIRSDKLMKLAEVLGISVLDLVMTEEQREARKEKMKRTKISEEQLRFALFNGEEVTDEQFQEVLRYRDYVLNRDKKE